MGPRAQLRTESYLVEQEAATTTSTIESLLPFVRSGTAARLADGSDAMLLDDAPKALAAKLPPMVKLGRINIDQNFGLAQRYRSFIRCRQNVGGRACTCHAPTHACARRRSRPRALWSW